MVDGQTQRILSAEELAKAGRWAVDDNEHEGVAAGRGGRDVAPRDVVGTR